MLSNRYDQAYGHLLADLASTPNVQPELLTAFWPKIGAAYDGELMVVGRAVNGWIDEITVSELGDPAIRSRLIAAARKTAEGDGVVCPMGWVTDAWGRGDGQYSTAKSAFWRHIRGVLAVLAPTTSEDSHWSSRLAWSNLAKVAPAVGGNPGGSLLNTQRWSAPELLRVEVEELQPRRVLVLTGRWWSEPFAIALGLRVDWRDGLVQGVAEQHGTRWVIAKHPQGKPRSMLDLVVEALNLRGRS